MRALLVFSLLFLITIISSVSRADTSSSETLREGLFLDSYLDAVRRHPEIAISHLAFIADASAVGANSIADANIYSDILKNGQIRRSVDRLLRYVPDVGLGVDVTIPLLPTGANLSLSAPLKPLMSSLIRSALGGKTDDEIRERMQQIVNDNPEMVKGLGRVVYESYKSTESPLASLHSLYWMAHETDPQLVAPDSNPKVYIESASPLLKGWLQSRLDALPVDEQNQILGDWPAFSQFLKDYPNSQPSSPTKSLDAVASSVGNQLAESLRQGYLPSEAMREALIDSADAPDLDNDIRTKLKEGFSDAGLFSEPRQQDFQKMRQNFDALQSGINSMATIFGALGRPSERRSLIFIGGLTQAASQATLAASAPTTLLAYSSGLGAVASLLAVAGMFSSQGPDPSADAIRAILQNEHLLLLQMDRVSAQISQLRSAVEELNYELEQLNADIIGHFDRLEADIGNLQWSVIRSKDEIQASLIELSVQSAYDAAAELRKDAINQILTDNLIRQDPVVSRMVRSDFTRIESLLKHGITLPPYMMQPDRDSVTLQPLPQPALPWSYTNIAATFIVDGTDYYHFSSPKFLESRPPGQADILNTALTSAEFLRDPQTPRVPEPGAFLAGATLLADATVRFPKGYKPDLDIAAICQIAAQSDKYWASIVTALPLASLSLHEDFQDVKKKWLSLVKDFVSIAFTNNDFGFLGEPWLRSYLMATGGRRLAETFSCGLGQVTNCDGLEIWAKSGPNLLVAMGLVEANGNYVRSDLLDHDIGRGGTKDSHACFRVAVVYPWSKRSRSEYPAEVASFPSGIIIGYKKICRSFYADFHGPADARSFFSGQRDMGEQIWDRWFPAWTVMELSQTADDIMQEPSVAPRVAASNSAALDMLHREELRLVGEWDRYMSQKTLPLTAFMDAVKFLKTDTIPFYFAIKVSNAQCRTDIRNDYLSHLLRFSDQDRFDSIADKIASSMTSGRISDVEAIVNKLSESESAWGYPRDFSQCFEEPPIISRARDVLSLAGQHLGLEDSVCK